MCDAFCGVHPDATKGAFHIPVTPHIYVLPLVKVSFDPAKSEEKKCLVVVERNHKKEIIFPWTEVRQDQGLLKAKAKGSRMLEHSYQVCYVKCHFTSLKSTFSILVYHFTIRCISYILF